MSIGAGDYGGGFGDRGDTGRSGLDAALSRGDWAGAMDAAFGSGGWGRDSTGGYGGGGSGSYNSATGTVMGIDRFGNFSVLGVPSLTGRGTMTTARGWEGDYGNIGIGNTAHSSHQGYYTGVQDRRREEAAARMASELGMFDQINKASDDPSLTGAFDAFYSGNMKELDNLGFNTEGMRGTHHGGGLLGEMFGWGKGADDVQTMSETEAELGKVDPDNPMGTSALGFAGYTAAPMIAREVAMLTRSPLAGVAAKKGTEWGARKVGEDLSPAMRAGLGGLGLLGVPAVGQLGQSIGMMNRAADLAYAGYTGSPTAPEARERNDGVVWPWV
jgi:hypothetical protein